MGPKLVGLCAAAPRIQHRHRRFVTEDARIGVHDRYLKLVKALCPPGRTLHPPRQGLPGQASVPGDRVSSPKRIFARRSKQRVPSWPYRSRSEVDGLSPERSCPHRIGTHISAGSCAIPAGLLEPDQEIKSFCHFLADAMQLAGATGTDRRFRLNHFFDTQPCHDDITDTVGARWASSALPT
jgi:hypothetical protein